MPLNDPKITATCENCSVESDEMKREFPFEAYYRRSDRYQWCNAEVAPPTTNCLNDTRRLSARKSLT